MARPKRTYKEKPKTAMIKVRVTESLKKDVQKASETTSISRYITNLITKDLYGNPNSGNNTLLSNSNSKMDSTAMEEIHILLDGIFTIVDDAVNLELISNTTSRDLEGLRRKVHFAKTYDGKRKMLEKLISAIAKHNSIFKKEFSNSEYESLYDKLKKYV